MVDTTKTAPTTVDVSVELFGSARMLTGRRQAQIAVPSQATITDLVAALAERCPDLVGKVILEDRSGLLKSYIFNLNGTAFVSEEPLQLKTGDTLLLFSSQAGG